MDVPTATYRLQFHSGFGFRQASAILDYLSALGVSHVYASPVFKARPGSTHGYDVEDHNSINPELGGGADFQDFCDRLKSLKLGLVQDIVPNHMAYSAGNRLLTDVLRGGRQSCYRGFFDVDWNHPSPDLRGAVAAPFLGGDIMESLQDISLQIDEDGITVCYYENRFPLALADYSFVLCGEEAPHELRRAAANIGQSAKNTWQEEWRECDAAVKNLWPLYCSDRDIHSYVNRRLEHFNQASSRPEFVELLQRQHFRLRNWRSAAEEINYRRFFDINELITLRQEDDAVFDYTHRLIARIVKEGIIAGLRIDHVDGLRDPAAYLLGLRRTCGDVYLTAEKILAMKEDLPAEWPVQGTTGYEFAAQINALLCCPDSEAELTRVYADATGNTKSFAEIGRLCKAQVLENQFAGDLDNVARKFEDVLKTRGATYEGAELKIALSEMLIALPVYRTYLSSAETRETDVEIIRKAVKEARSRRPELAPVLSAVEAHILEEKPGEEDSGIRKSAWASFEQLAAPLTAKGIEDTALYRYSRLSALNEVGGDPGFMTSTDETFHAFATVKQARWPHTMNALSTHDTKRSGDVRARLLAIAELPEEWSACWKAWRDCNARHAVETAGGRVPDAEMEYLLYQTIAATLPAAGGDLSEYRSRIGLYMNKAAREAKQRTSWLRPDAEYEAAMSAFVGRILDPSNDFVRVASPFAARLARLGLFNSLSQTAIHLTAPGIPDIYQGCELFDDSLVDPDNRRPVDFERRRRWLKEIEDGCALSPADHARHLLENGGDGRLKLFVIWAGLHQRRRHAALFSRGVYEPLRALGSKQRHVICYLRRLEGDACLTLVPRFPALLMGGGEYPAGEAVWRDTAVELPSEAARRWHNIFTGESITTTGGMLPVSDALSCFPVAVFEKWRDV